MTPRILLPVALAGVLSAVPEPLRGQQTVGEALRGLDAANAAEYAGPFVRSIVRGLVTGLGDRSGVPAPLSLRVGIRATAVRPPSDHGEFLPVLPATVTFEGETWADPWVLVGEGISPTATGVGNGSVVAPRPGSPFEDALRAAGRDPEEVRLVLPPGLDVEPVPLVVLEGDLGLPGGTVLAFRATPTVRVFGDVGDASAFGAALSHDAARWFLGPDGRAHVNVGVAVQRLAVGGWMKAFSTGWSVTAGMDAGPLGIRATAASVEADVDVRYRVVRSVSLPGFPDDGEVVSFSADLDGETHAAVGASLDLGRLELVGDWILARRPGVSAAAFIRLR